MKRLTFSLCALAAIAGVCILTNIVFQHTAKEFSKTIEYYAVTVTRESEIASFSQDIEQIWEKKKFFISVFSAKGLLDNADERIKQLKYSDSVEQFRLCCRRAQEAVIDAADSDIPKIEKILLISRLSNSI